MSKIIELINEKDTILVFDVDGVLAKMEWGKYNHYELTDEEWIKMCEAGENAYTQERVFKKMQDFLKNRNMDRIYVITKVGSYKEGEFKKEFVSKYYNISPQNVYCVEKDIEKKIKLFEIKEKYQELEDFQVVMIDDTVNVLNDIMENTGFSTVHISSFLDI